MNDPVILLNPEDNVVVCGRAVLAGEIMNIAGRTVVVACDVALGHKIARAPINPGLPIIKYGMSIGSATAAIAPGDWVHLHNMRSNYIATHSRTQTGNES